MKKLTTRTVKILVNSDSFSAVDLIELEQWENEGGFPSPAASFVESMAPLKRGEIFEVKSFQLSIIDEKLVWDVEIEILVHH